MKNLPIETIISQHRTDTEQHRTSLQKNIIGACLLEATAISKVGDLLSIKNFTGPYKQIYQQMLDMYNHTAIDIRTVYSSCSKAKGNGLQINLTSIALHLSDCISSVNSSANLQIHALMLVEYSIIDQVIQAYATNEKTAVSEAMGHEIIVDLIVAADKLKSIQAARLWMHQALPDDPFTAALDEISQHIGTKAAKIKSKERVRALLNQLQALSGQPKDQPMINRLMDTLIQVINDGSPSAAFDDQVYSLQSHFTTSKQLSA